MKLSFNDIEQIVESYLLNNLSGEDTIKFEEALTTDPNIQAELTRQKIIRNLMLENELSTIRKGVSKTILQEQRIRKIKTGAIILGVILISSIGLYFWKPTKHKTTVLNPKKEESTPERNHEKHPSIKLKDYQKVDQRKADQRKSTLPKELKENITHSEFIKESTKKKKIKLKNDTTNQKLVTKDSLSSVISPGVHKIINEKVNTVICDTFHPQFNINTELSSRYLNNGKISIETQKGVSAFMIGEEEKGAKEFFVNLAPGYYQFILTKDECKFETEQVEVGELLCEEKRVSRLTRKNEIEWTAIDLEVPGTLKVYDSRRMLIFEQQFGSFDKKIWNGKLNDQTKAYAGVYLVHYEMKNETCEISLTIFD